MHTDIGARDQLAQPRHSLGPAVTLGLHKTHDHIGLRVFQPGTLGEIAAVVLAALAQQGAHALRAEAVQLVDGAQHDAAFGILVVSGKARNLQHTVQHLAVVHAHHIVAACDPDLFQTIGQHRANLGIRRH